MPSTRNGSRLVHIHQELNRLWQQTQLPLQGVPKTEQPGDMSSITVTGAADSIGYLPKTNSTDLIIFPFSRFYEPENVHITEKSSGDECSLRWYRRIKCRLVSNLSQENSPTWRSYRGIFSHEATDDANEIPLPKWANSSSSLGIGHLSSTSANSVPWWV